VRDFLLKNIESSKISTKYSALCIASDGDAFYQLLVTCLYNLNRDRTASKRK
jgi:hypothetical protein